MSEFKYRRRGTAEWIDEDTPERQALKAEYDAPSSQPTTRDTVQQLVEALGAYFGWLAQETINAKARGEELSEDDDTGLFGPVFQQMFNAHTAGRAWLAAHPVEE